MDARHFIEELVPTLTLNASVVEITEEEGRFRIAIAGTTGVIAHCDVPRDVIMDAAHEDHARRQLETVLKQCADDTVAAVPDGRA